MMTDNPTAAPDVAPVLARHFIYLSYDGTAYHGWQVQPNGISVQQRLAEALSTILRTTIEVTGAGRTDAGVHAAMMVAHFDAVAGSFDCGVLADKLNRLLPPDIAVSRIVPVRPDAHARFDATSRTYNYYVTRRKCPFTARYRWRLHTPLDVAAMNEAAATLMDYTDFTSFSRLHTDVKTNNCHITEARWDLSSPPTASCATWCGPWWGRSSRWGADGWMCHRSAASSRRVTDALPGNRHRATPCS